MNIVKFFVFKYKQLYLLGAFVVLEKSNDEFLHSYVAAQAAIADGRK